MEAMVRTDSRGTGAIGPALGRGLSPREAVGPWDGYWNGPSNRRCGSPPLAAFVPFGKAIADDDLQPSVAGSDI